MEKEEWKDITWIPNLPTDKYSISSFGRIRNNYTKTIRKNVTRYKGTQTCLLSNAPRMKKQLIHYKMISHCHNKQYKTFNVTIATQVAIAFLPPPDRSNPDYVIHLIHKDQNLYNNHASNLMYTYTKSHKAKIRDRIRIRKRKLSDSDVHKICMMLVEENGNLQRTKMRLTDILPHVTCGQIEAIKYKMYYIKISDLYFKYFDRNFIPL